MNANDLIVFDGVSAGYGGVTVLDRIDLRVSRGDVLAVLGRNGAGKTTLLNALFNLGPELGGRITVKGEAVAGWPTHRIARLGLALVPQGRGVFHTLAVHESLRLATLARKATGAWTLDRVYREFPRLHERRLASSGALSGGERQMLALARALLTQADTIVLDEPSEGLAPLAVEEVLVHHVARLAADGLTVVLAEQNVAMALKVATRALVLSAGRVVFDGTPAALAADQALHQEHLGV